MRKAFTLIEMLLIITIAPLMLVVISGIFATFIQDIPRETRVVQQSTTMLDMLRQVRQDVDEAVGLPERVGDTARRRAHIAGRPAGCRDLLSVRGWPDCADAAERAGGRRSE